MNKKASSLFSTAFALKGRIRTKIKMINNPRFAKISTQFSFFTPGSDAGRFIIPACAVIGLMDSFFTGVFFHNALAGPCYGKNITV